MKALGSAVQCESEIRELKKESEYVRNWLGLGICLVFQQAEAEPSRPWVSIHLNLMVMDYILIQHRV